MAEPLPPRWLLRHCSAAQGCGCRPVGQQHLTNFADWLKQSRQVLLQQGVRPQLRTHAAWPQATLHQQTQTSNAPGCSAPHVLKVDVAPGHDMQLMARIEAFST